MAHLYEIANEYAALMAEDMDPEMIQDTLEGIEGEMEDKISNILALIKNKRALADALKAEADNLSKRSKAELAAIERIKDYIALELTKVEKTSFQAGIHSITVRKGVKSVSIDDGDKIPDEFVEYVTDSKYDKKRLALELKAGKEVPGASLKTGKPSLIIK